MSQISHENVLADIGIKLQELGGNLSGDNLSMTLNQIQLIKTVLEGIRAYDDLVNIPKELPDLRDGSFPSELEKEYDESLTKRKSEAGSILNDQKDNGIPADTGYFERDLRGGYINGIYIGEAIVRGIGLSHGDFVRVTDNDGGKKYVEIIERGIGDREDRIQIDFCLVEKWNSNLVIRQYFIHDTFETLPIKMIFIPPDVVAKMKLSANDLVDIAYFKNNPNYVQIIWRHDVNRPDTSSPKNSSFYKKTPHLTETDMSLKHIYPELVGKRVLIIGGDDRHPDYRQAFEDCGAVLNTLEGNARPEQLSIAVKKADVVVIVCSAIRTHTAHHAFDICKELGVPSTRLHNDGIRSVLTAAAHPKSGNSIGESNFNE